MNPPSPVLGSNWMRLKVGCIIRHEQIGSFLIHDQSAGNGRPFERPGTTATVLIFEPLSRVHASSLYNALNHPSVHQYIDATSYRSEAALMNFIERVNRGPEGESTDEWINVVALLGGALIGQIQTTVHNDWAEIAFLFDPTFQGNGYATETVKVKFVKGRCFLMIQGISFSKDTYSNAFA